MFNKKVGAMVLTGAMVLQGGITSFAAGFSTEGEEGGQNATSTGRISLTALENETPNPTDPILPVDPENPDGEDEDGGTGNTGVLRVDWVSPFEFGEYSTPTETTTYTLSNRDEDPFVQVSDFRGVGTGWELQAAISEFTDGTNTLRGAELNLPAGTLTKAIGNQSDAPTGNEAITLGTTGSTIIKADEGEGMGTWASSFDKNEVELIVPAGNQAGDYQATLTWTFSDAIN